MDFDLEWESGFDPENAQDVFEEMLAESDEELVVAMTESSLEIEADARRRSPVDTGNLRGAWTSEVETEGETIIAEIGNEAAYAAFVEFGTNRMAAQPMIRPAIEREIRDLERRIREAVYEAAEEARQ
ncbi:HK97-gp10 family putative phage morphogenesis protein [Natrarchaeobaculum sulfurireducens]|uniref:Bacteriophage HK97-gp10-like protein n=1 Tax=Natrarchaeobaculum sulfurireducens TaxID=2044521 RepID=A0A346PHJ2_9EURY|nr:HK97-gp10 family putative phage morphogenesis protein [Natrarchaeobaculum sulfurireducens]AXR78987.1 Bacteriophage HK97-gp10-like protein [Natrarchaeobaculum sulfurireducens]